MTPPRSPDRQQKRQTLRRHGTLNLHPEAVSHPLFHNSDFFDSDDLIQVKYEMLRQVHIDRDSISESAQALDSHARRSIRLRRRCSRTACSVCFRTSAAHKVGTN